MKLGTTLGLKISTKIFWPILVTATALGLGGCDRSSSTAKPAVPSVVTAPSDAVVSTGPDLGPDLGDDTITPLAVRALANEACPSISNAYFWKVTSPSPGSTPSYLLGSMHIGIDPLKLPPSVFTAFDNASRVVFETDPALDKSVQPEDDFRLPDDAPGLDVQLGAESWARYGTLLGLPPAARANVARVKPATAAVLLMALYLDKEVTIDGWLGERAISKKIPTGGLETSAFQEAILAKWLDLRSLRSGITLATSRRKMRDEAKQDIAEYCDGVDDTPGMDPDDKADMLATGYTEQDIADFENELLTKRNQAWIPLLTPMFDKGNVFVVVGADHLRGPGGVVTLLAAKGYTVTRVTP